MVRPTPITALAVAFVASACFSFLLRILARRSPRFGRAGPDGPAPVPPLGGLAILPAFLLHLLVLPGRTSPGLWAWATAMGLVGLVDDVHPLTPRVKLVLQATVVTLATGGGLRLEVTGLALADGVLTAVWLIFACNAFNVLDMEDGLSSGTGAIACLGLWAVSLGLDVPGVAAPSAALAGALGGFLIHNVHPARMYMGDTGSLATGFLLGGMAVAVSSGSLGPRGIVCPLLVLGVPCFEAIFVALVRAAKGRPVMRASRDHVAQRLVKMGYSVRGAVGRVYAAGALLAVVAAASAFGPAWVCWVALGVCGLSALHLTVRLADVGTDREGRGSGSPFAEDWLVRRITEGAIADAATHASGRLLDVGCGRQPYRGALEGRTSRYVGLEGDVLRYSGSGPDVWGDALALPFAPRTFDTVLCSQVLEHVPEPGHACEEMARVLRHGGYLILTAPHIWGIHEAPRDFYRYTPYGLRYLAERAGLAVVEIRALGGYWITAGARLCYYLSRFARGPLTPIVRLQILSVHMVALLLDRLHCVEADAWNHLMVARKPAGR